MPALRQMTCVSCVVSLFLCSPMSGGQARCPHADSAPTPHAPHVDAAFLARIDRSLAHAAGYLVSRQSPDGRWTSGHYGSFRDDLALTPHVLSALAFLPAGGDAAATSVDKGLEALRRPITSYGRIDDSCALGFPIYTAAEASWLFTLRDSTPAARRAQSAWLTYLRERQLNEHLGWKPTDTEYGGWSYAIDIPRKPEIGEPRAPLVESNLSATIFALGALVSADVPRDDPSFAQALTFVKRCQNFSDDPTRAHPDFDDGGFFFIPNDAAKNKAGVAGHDRFGRTRYHSYGSMTADGVRALLQCGLPLTHPRVVAARRWLERNITLDHNAGHWADDRQVIRDAAYYYYCWSLTHALARLNIRTIDSPTGPIDWPIALAEKLMQRQNADGAWTNRYTDSKEDDPLVATPFATAALAICRKTLTNPAPTQGKGHSGAAHVIHSTFSPDQFPCRFPACTPSAQRGLPFGRSIEQSDAHDLRANPMA